MITGNPILDEIMNNRRRAVEESLRPMSAAELNELTNELFPHLGHPWREKFLEVVNDPANGAFYHAMVDDRVHVFYCHDKGIGLWFIQGSGMGMLLPEHLKMMKDIVERSS